METTTKHICPQCSYTSPQSGLCPRCDYRVKLVPEGQKKPPSAEKIISYGLLHTLDPDSQSQIMETVKALHQALDRLPQEEALVAVMVFTSEYADKV